MGADRVSLEEKLVRKAWEDAEFLQELRDDTTRVLERFLREELGEAVSLPSGCRAYLHEEVDGEVHLVVPPNPNQADPALCDPRQCPGTFGGTCTGGSPITKGIECA